MMSGFDDFDMEPIHDESSMQLVGTFMFMHHSMLVDPNFRWKDNRNEFHHPRDMSTEHVFCVLRMVWNHAMPEEARTHNYHRYSFSSFYTADYVRQAVIAMIQELGVRNDLSPKYQEQYDWMKGFFFKRIQEDK